MYEFVDTDMNRICGMISNIKSVQAVVYVFLEVEILIFFKNGLGIRMTKKSRIF
jgi:hypothetical protein